ncbi:MAG TPA: two pore domain potassium channel family protein, partial [Chloroflexi bacterium]|nr:two pore domain potassium channel family protein [Chloroflexota bacterium]
MRALVAIGALFLIAIVLWDTFETIVLPRRVTRQITLSRWFLRIIWRFWSAVARRMNVGRAREDLSSRETFLSFYGPLSLLLLLIFWAVTLITGFGALQWALGSLLNAPEGSLGFGVDVYMSGTTFFTLGLGDVVPVSSLARAITVVEAGTGFGFLALVIGYLPVLYQAFSRREMRVSLLDARAGSPPRAVE